MQKNASKKKKKTPIKKVEETRPKDTTEEAVKKLEFIICKSLNGNISTKNLIKLFDIQQEIDERNGHR